MKKVHKSNPIQSLWHRVLVDGRIYELAIEFRKKLKIPINGFASSDDYNFWLGKRNIKKKQAERMAIINAFIETAKELFPHQSLVSEIGFRPILIDFFYFGEVDEELLNKLNDLGMSIVIIKNGKKFLSHSEEVADGVYLRLKDFSTISNIFQYVEKYKGLIKSAMALYTQSQNLVKPRRVKTGENFKRDKMITDLNDYTKKEIEDYLGVIKDYKHDSISELMKRMGIADVTGAIVKTVIQRRRIKK